MEIRAIISLSVSLVLTACSTGQSSRGPASHNEETSQEELAPTKDTILEKSLEINLAGVELCSELVKKQQVPVGAFCKTSKNGLFRREEHGYKDLKTDTIWFDEIKTRINQYDSEKYCKGKGLELPTGYPKSLNGKNGFPNHDSDFVAATNNGLQEVFPNRGANSLIMLWSSSVDPESKYAPEYAFELSHTSIFSTARISAYIQSGARCVAHPKKGVARDPNVPWGPVAAPDAGQLKAIVAAAKAFWEFKQKSRRDVFCPMLTGGNKGGEFPGLDAKFDVERSLWELDTKEEANGKLYESLWIMFFSAVPPYTQAEIDGNAPEWNPCKERR